MQITYNLAKLLRIMYDLVWLLRILYDEQPGHKNFKFREIMIVFDKILCPFAIIFDQGLQNHAIFFLVKIFKRIES